MSTGLPDPWRAERQRRAADISAAIRYGLVECEGRPDFQFVESSELAHGQPGQEGLEAALNMYFDARDDDRRHRPWEAGSEFLLNVGTLMVNLGRPEVVFREFHPAMVAFVGELLMGEQGFRLRGTPDEWRARVHQLDPILPGANDDFQQLLKVCFRHERGAQRDSFRHVRRWAKRNGFYPRLPTRSAGW